MFIPDDFNMVANIPYSVGNECPHTFAGEAEGPQPVAILVLLFLGVLVRGDVQKRRGLALVDGVDPPLRRPLPAEPPRAGGLVGATGNWK